MRQQAGPAVAFLGLGRMGAPMAGRVSAAGFPLAVYNRTSRPEAAPAGAAVGKTPRETVAAADVAITMVADAHALDELLGGPDGILAGAHPGTILIDMSTIGPDAARAVAERCAAAGVAFLDAPVSGSTAAAASGELVTIVGGDQGALDRARPVLAALTREQLWLGPTGAGAAMKLALNLAVAVTNQTVAEALALSERSGVSRARAYDVLSAGAVASPYVGYKREAFLDPDATQVAFSIDLMAKDVDLALGVADDVGVTLPVVEAVRSQLQQARDAGLGARDIATVLSIYG
jgi:3-hydroxyisobutyrate dehydrogenase/2-hydroxy-3-oxopropionate reductase